MNELNLILQTAPQTFDIGVIIVVLVICTGALTLFAKYKK